MNFENFMNEIKEAAQDTSLTPFVRSLCNFTVTALENGNVDIESLTSLEKFYNHADVALIHGEMGPLTRHELVDSMHDHIVADDNNSRIKMLASDIFVHYDLLLKNSGPKTAILNVLRAISHDAASSHDDSDHRSDIPTKWREALVKALSDEFRITIG